MQRLKARKRDEIDLTEKVKGRATIRTAAVFFLASAVFEIMDLSSAVALFGGVRVGAVAGMHRLLRVLYVLSGIGMWTAKPWGYQAFMPPAIYTIDKIQLDVVSPSFLRLYFAAADGDTLNVGMTAEAAAY